LVVLTLKGALEEGWGIRKKRQKNLTSLATGTESRVFIRRLATFFFDPMIGTTIQTGHSHATDVKTIGCLCI